MKKIVFILALSFLFAQPCLAQIFVEQGKVEHEISPGQNIAGNVTVHNTSDQPLTIRVYWEDFRYEAPYDGKKKFLPAGTTPYSLSGWATVSAQSFTLPGYGKKDVNYVINPPAELKGGYYGVLFFEKAPESVSSSHGINIVARVGSLFFLEPADRIKKASISSWSFESDALQGKFKNEGDVILIPKGVFYVLDDSGVAVDRGEIEKMYIPPGEEADFSFSLSPELGSGHYNAVVTFDLNEGDVVVKELTFVKSGGSLNIQDIKD